MHNISNYIIYIYIKLNQHNFIYIIDITGDTNTNFYF